MWIILTLTWKKIIFNQMLNENQFSNVSNYTVFDLSNAILKKDYNPFYLGVFINYNYSFLNL